MNDRSILAVDKEQQQARQIVQSLFHNVLHEYIAYANRRDVMDKLFEFFEKAEIAVISKEQLKIYQALEANTLNIIMLNKE